MARQQRNRLERFHCTSNHTTQAKAKWQLARGNLPHFVAGFSSFSYLMYQWQSCCDVRTNPFPLPDDVPYLVWIGVFWVLLFETFGNESVSDILQWHFPGKSSGVRGEGRVRFEWFVDAQDMLNTEEAARRAIHPVIALISLEAHES
jgi:hypothetical protein